MSRSVVDESDESSQDEQDVFLVRKHSKRTVAELYDSDSDGSDANQTSIEKTPKRNIVRKSSTKRKKKQTAKSKPKVLEVSVPEEEMKEPNTPPTEQPSPEKNIDKPTITYATMIAQALSSQANRRLTLQEIYQWIMDKYPYYKNDDHGWRSSVRHNLSQREYFSKVVDGDKRAVYELNATHEDNLLKGLTGRKLARHLRKEKDDDPAMRKQNRARKQTKQTLKSTESLEPQVQLPFTWFNPTWSCATSNGQLYQPLNLFRPMVQYMQNDQIVGDKVTGETCFENKDTDHSMFVTEPPPSPEASHQ